MQPRLKYWTIAPEGVKAMTALYKYLPACGLEPALIHLVFLRVSQINGCAYCVDLHTRDALAAGDTPRRVATVVTWRETPFFTPRERAAFAWAEAVTRIAETHAPASDYDVLTAPIFRSPIVYPTLAFSLRHPLNRMAVRLRRAPTA